MRKSLLTVASMLIGIVFVSGGCSASGAAWESFRIGKNVAKKDSYLKIWIDGHEAEQNKLKKAYFGYASFKVKETVSTKPTFKFDFIDPKKFGRITGTNIQVHQEFEGDYSHQPEFTIFPAKDDADHWMKPNTDYDLGHTGEQLKVLNFDKKEVEGIELRPGMEYLFVFCVSGDRSETVQILFSTK